MNTSARDLQKTVYSIQSILLNNENIRKLIGHMTPDALELGNVSRAIVEQSVLVVPYIDKDDPDKELGQNAFIAIYPTRIMPSEIGEHIFINISVYVNKDHYLLNNNRIRLFELLHEIETSVGNTKLNLAGKLILTETEFVSLDNSKRLGAVQAWSVVNG